MISLVIGYGLIGVLLWVCVAMALRDRVPVVINSRMLLLLLPLMIMAWHVLVIRSFWK